MSSADAREDLSFDDSPRGRVLDAHLHLLDRQLVDRDGVPVATVDDVELTDASPGQQPRIAALLSGPVLWTRIFAGQPRRSHLEEAPWRDVTSVDVVVALSGAADDYDANWSERWVREHIVGRIPGGRHAPD
ncbi:hypothetical protein [Gryllotalpicola protaetiae]|uniref:PRC-barrel domain containing protein n=1 Tax=Gryllotalpicola protaetiae TaxID=2419771 RepID=A0A387BX52_9MICO|nr:hypothetical protein [Gryllotalpicola protaetiae]AYG05427.1 hypothetical protein D7I44_13145 [Gryllotalpicola protaetiae]